MFYCAQLSWIVTKMPKQNNKKTTVILWSSLLHTFNPDRLKSGTIQVTAHIHRNPCAGTHTHTYINLVGSSQCWVASFKVTGSILGSELPISVCSIEIGLRCILEGEHLKLAVAKWNWICREGKTEEWAEWSQNTDVGIYRHAQRHSKVIFSHCCTH